MLAFDVRRAALLVALLLPVTTATAAPLPAAPNAPTGLACSSQPRLHVYRNDSATATLACTSPTGHVLTVTITKQPTLGTATFTFADLTYTTNAGALGDDEIGLSVTDGTDTVTTTVPVTIGPEPVITITTVTAKTAKATRPVGGVPAIVVVGNQIVTLRGTVTVAGAPLADAGLRVTQGGEQLALFTTGADGTFAEHVPGVTMMTELLAVSMPNAPSAVPATVWVKMRPTIDLEQSFVQAGKIAIFGKMGDAVKVDHGILILQRRVKKAWRKQARIVIGRDDRFMTTFPTRLWKGPWRLSYTPRAGTPLEPTTRAISFKRPHGF